MILDVAKNYCHHLMPGLHGSSSANNPRSYSSHPKESQAVGILQTSSKNKPRCYPQQRLGNNASKENLRATLPNPKPFQKTFFIIYTANTKLRKHRMHLSSVTTTTHTRASAETSATATGSPTRSFSIRSGTSRLEPCLDPPETHPEPWSLAWNLPRNLLEP